MTKDDYPGLAEAILGEAGAQRISAAELARLTGISMRTMYRITTGKKDVLMSELAAIAEALDVDVDYLIRQADARSGSVGGRPGKAPSAELDALRGGRRDPPDAAAK